MNMKRSTIPESTKEQQLFDLMLFFGCQSVDEEYREIHGDGGYLLSPSEDE